MREVIPARWAREAVLGWLEGQAALTKRTPDLFGVVTRLRPRRMFQGKPFVMLSIAAQPSQEFDPLANPGRFRAAP